MLKTKTNLATDNYKEQHTKSNAATDRNLNFLRLAEHHLNTDDRIDWDKPIGSVLPTVQTTTND